MDKWDIGQPVKQEHQEKMHAVGADISIDLREQISFGLVVDYVQPYSIDRRELREVANIDPRLPDTDQGGDYYNIKGVAGWGTRQPWQYPADFTGSPSKPDWQVITIRKFYDAIWSEVCLYDMEMEAEDLEAAIVSRTKQIHEQFYKIVSSVDDLPELYAAWQKATSGESEKPQKLECMY